MGTAHGIAAGLVTISAALHRSAGAQSKEAGSRRMKRIELRLKACRAAARNDARDWLGGKESPRRLQERCGRTHANGSAMEPNLPRTRVPHPFSAPLDLRQPRGGMK